MSDKLKIKRYMCETCAESFVVYPGTFGNRDRGCPFCGKKNIFVLEERIFNPATGEFEKDDNNEI